LKGITKKVAIEILLVEYT